MKRFAGIPRLLVISAALVPALAFGQGQGRAKFKPTDKYVPGQVIVRYKDAVVAPKVGAAASSANAGSFALAGAKVTRSFRKLQNLRVVQLPEGVSVPQALARLQGDPNVLYAEPDFIFHSDEIVPNDPQFGTQWALKNTGLSGGTVNADIDATDAWSLSTGSNSVIVGVIDSGADISHADLAANIFSNPSDCNSNGIDEDGDGKINDCHGWNAAYDNPFPYDDVGHGTHVSGTIGAVGNNGLGVVGVNWQVTIVPCKFLVPDGYGGGVGALSDAVECLDYFAAMKDAGYNIVATNNSWGGGGYSQALYDAIKENMDRGILFIAAAGNGGADGVGDNNDQTTNYPSNYDLPNIIAVEATTRTDSRASFSNYGRRTVDLGAPGQDILSTLPGGEYGIYSGTSMATPHVTGAVALLKAWNPALSVFEIRNLLFATGDTKPGTAQTVTGKRLNVNNAMHCVNSTMTQRTLPAQSTLTAGVGAPLLLEELNVNCNAGAGNVVVSVSPGGGTVTLTDDGANGDRIANDGFYSGNWAPPAAGTYTLAFPGADVVTVTALQPYAYVPEPYNYRNFTGTNLNLGDDTSATITSPFPIDFGGKTFTQLKVGSNGVLSFVSGYNSANESIPTPATNDLIAPFWMDLMPQGSSNPKNVFWTTLGTAPNRELVVEWRNVPFWWYNVDLTATVKFQVVFFENSSDIVFNYADVLFYDGNYDGDSGGYATVGIQVGRDSGRQFSFFEKSLRNGMALRWKAGQPDYVLELDDTPQNTAPDSPVTFHGKVRAAPGYTGTITLSCTSRISDPPPICTPSPATVGAGDEFTVQASSAAYGLFRFNVSGDDGTFPRDAKAELQVGDFVFLPIADSDFTMPRRSFSSSLVTVSATRISATQDFIVVGCSSGLPPGLTCYSALLDPAQAQTSTQYIYFNADPNVVPGTYQVTLRASMNGSPEVQTQTISLTITLNPSIKLNGLGVISLLRGNSTSFPFTTQALDGYDGNATLLCDRWNSNPLPVSCTFDPPVVHGDADVSVTVLAPTTDPVETTNIVVKAVENATQLDYISPTLNIFDYTVSATPASTSLVIGGNANLAVTMGGVSGEQVVIGCSGLPPGVSCVATPSSQWPGFPVTVNLSSDPAITLPGTTTFMVTGSAMGGVRHSANLTLKTTDFSLSSASSGDLLVNVAGSTARSIQAKALAGFTGSLALSCSVAESPVGVSCSVPTSVTPTTVGASVSVSVAAILAAAPGPYTITVNATAFGRSHSYSFTAQVRDYHLNSTPTSQKVGTVPSGQTDHTTYALSLFADKGFSNSVTLSCATPLPTGVTCGFTPATLTPTAGGAASTLNVTVSSTTPPNTYQLNVKATSGSIVRQLPLSLTTGGPNLTQAISPAMVNAIRGGAGSYTVTYTLLGGMSDPIAVGCSTPAAGVTCSAVPDSVVPGVTPSNQSVVTFNPTGSTPAANTTVTITGSAIGIVRSSAATLSVKDFSLSSTTAGDISVNAGAAAVRTFQVKSLNGLSGTVALSCAIDGAPAGVTCSVPATTTPSSTGVSVNATVATTAAAPAGGYVVTVSGTNAGQTRQYQFTLQVRDYTVISDDSVSIGNIPAGQTDSVLNAIILTAQNGFNSTVSLTCVAPLPTGVTCSLNPVSLVPSPGPLPVSHSDVMLKVSPTTPNGVYPINVRLTSGTVVKTKTFTLNVGGPNFLPVISPTTAGSLLGTPATYTVTFLTAGGMNTAIDISCDSGSGVFCVANPAQVTPGVTPGNQSTITVTGTPGTTPLANQLFAVHAHSSDLNRTRTIGATYTPRDFSLTTTTPARTVNAGSSISNGVTVKALNGFTGAVALGCSIDSAPAGMTCTTPASVSPSSTGTGLAVTVATTTAVPAGTYTVHVNGTNSGQTRSMSFTVDVRDFTLDVSPPAQTIAGTGAGSTTFSLTLTSLNGFATATALSCMGPLPTGVTCAFTPASLVPTGAGASSTLKVSVTASTTQGDHPLTIRTASGALVRQQTVTVTHGP